MLITEEQKLCPYAIIMIKQRSTRQSGSGPGEQGQKGLQIAEDHIQTSNSDYEDSQSDSETLLTGGTKLARAASISYASNAMNQRGRVD